MVRSSDDTGNTIVIKQLKSDYKNILNSSNSSRVKEIKQVAHTIILDKFPAFEQRNMTATSVTLALQDELSEEEDNELQSIFDAWAWINLVRNASNTAENDGILAKDIIWPEIS